MSFYRRTVGLIAAFVCLGSPLFAGEPVPNPPSGEAATTVLSLIRFKHRGCDQIAGRVVDHWLKYGGANEEQEEKARDYVLKSELSDLAASRAAADIVAKLMPRLKTEVSGETYGTMERLDTAVTSLCNTVALPTGPLSAFRQRLGDVLALIEREETELGRLVTIPSATSLETAIEPYLEAIQLAGIAAESEYQQYLESLRPKKAKETFKDQMVAWHRQVYLPAVTPAKTAWGKYLQAREKLDSRGMNAACRELSQALIPLLRDPAPFKSPDPKLEEPLRLAYVDLRAMATSCTAGDSGQLNRRWADFNGRLQNLSQTLQRYGIQP